jgi:hypothetical protein
MKLFKFALLTLALVAVSTSTCFATTLTFATVFGQTYNMARAGTSTTATSNTLTATNGALPSVYFMYLGGVTLSDPSGAGLQLATISFTATSTTAATGGPAWNQIGYAGSFSILRTSDGKNLLSGTFGPSGQVNMEGFAGTSKDSMPPPTEVFFTSDFLSFADPQSENALAFDLTGVNHGGVGGFTMTTNHFFNPFTGTGSGTFSGDVNTIPEPAAMALMGIGLLGLGILRRRIS